MKITYIKLVNVAGLKVGSDKHELEIDFSKSKNKIIAIQGRNTCGKTTLLSSLTPYAYTTSLDERSSLSYIMENKDGYKEIHYKDDDNIYVIKHYYKSSKNSHTVKSYISKNGKELNENGNVTSFIPLVEIHMGLTQEMMRLVRLGTNVSSFINLTPARRKEYIGKLISEIDAYMKIYKKINEDIKVVNVLLKSNSSNLYNCHITDIIIEEEKLLKLSKDISKHENERDKIIAKIGKIQNLMKGNDISELRNRRKEAEASIIEFNKTESTVKRMSLQHTTLDQLIKLRSNISSEIIDIQSKINSYRISIDNAMRSIERLELSVKKITSNNDIQSLLESIKSIKDIIESTSKIVSTFKYPKSISSNDIHMIINKLSSFNKIGQMIYTFGNKPVKIYLKLKNDNRVIDKFLKEQMKRSVNRINEDNLKSLINKIFDNDMIISPNCESEYISCPYYRLSEAITGLKDKLEEELYDDETLRYIQVISNNIDNILNELDIIKRMSIPDSFKDILTERSILDRMKNKFSLFDLSNLQEYLTIMREYELYQENIGRLKQYEYQLSIYKKSGIDSHLEEIKQLNNSIDFYRNNISTLTQKIDELKNDLSVIDEKISIVTKYNDGKKYKKIFESTLESTNKILIPLENASNEKMELDFLLDQITKTIDHLREQHRNLENKINEYNRLIEEGKNLKTKYDDLKVILKAVSTKEGIPVIYMKRYLKKIKDLANELLRIIYNDKFKLAKFKVTQDTFEVPYIKNGSKIPDVKYASQSEVELSTMALSFALSNEASKNYNILLLDEIDSGLDEDTRPLFLKMLYKQINILHSEQVFIISQNLTAMANIPMDCIRLSEINYRSKLQNIIS